MNADGDREGGDEQRAKTKVDKNIDKKKRQ